MNWLILISIVCGLFSWALVIGAIILARKEKIVHSVSLMYVSFVCALLTISCLLMPYFIFAFAGASTHIKDIVLTCSTIFAGGTCGLNGVALNIIGKNFR